MNTNDALDMVENCILSSLKELAEAFTYHIPFGIAVNKINGKETYYLKYIPERCLTTYFAKVLIDKKFVVFNEQSYESKNGKIAKLDLLARKISPEEKDSIQLKIEAKGNLDSGYQEIVNDIRRMKDQKLDLKIGVGFPLNENMVEESFSHRFNIVITTDWGLSELSEWWTEGVNNQDAPFIKGSHVTQRNKDSWGPLKNELMLAAKRGKHDMVKNDIGNYSIHALYAIFPV